jgi:hypothetical protein
MLMMDDGVVAAYGVTVEDVPAYAISEVVAGRRSALEAGGRR